MARGDTAKRLIGGIYSWAADKVYEPLVVNGAFKVFGGDLHERVAEQGRAAVRIAEGRPILDLPVGTATFTIPIAREHGGVVVGVDIAAGMVQQAQRMAGASGVTNLFGVQADAHHLPFRDATFGAIMCTNGLQVMPGLMETLNELRRVLADDGMLYVSVVHLPVSPAPNAPTLFMSRTELQRAFGRAGFAATNRMDQRLATFIQAQPR